MAISDLFGVLFKRQTTPDKYLQSSVNIMNAGLHGTQRQPFSYTRSLSLFRSWVYAAATINANAVASTPLRLYSKRRNTRLETRSIPNHRKTYLMGDSRFGLHPSSTVIRKASSMGDDLEEVVGSNPVIDLINSSNPFLNGFDTAVLRILYGELTGNAYFHPIIDQMTGMPTELWPLAPHYVEIMPCDETFVKGYLYGIDSQTKQVFAPDEVIHFRRPNPGNYYYGLGKVEAAYGVIQANEAVHEMDISFFENSARPDYAVVVKGTPTGDQLDRFQQQVEERLRGTRKEGSFLAMTGDVTFQPLNFPPKDLAGREEIVEEIAAVFGVPVSMLKTNDPNLASATSGFAQWREGTVLPLCRMDEEELNQSLLPLFGMEDDYLLAYDNPVPLDRNYELQERQAAVAGGWRTPNEARAEEGREPSESEFADMLLIGGQPLGASVGLSDGFPPVEQAVEAPTTVEQASAVVSAFREGKMSDYTAIKMLQVCGWDRGVAERIVKAEKKAASGAAKREKIHRMPDEPVSDCIERGIEVLTAEGYDRDQAVAMAHSMCEETKAVSDVDLKPTAGMAALAERGLKLRKEHGRGGTMVGVARARDISNRADLSPETIGRMANFFGRHRVDLDAPAAKPGHENYPSNGVIAWLLWGGDPNNPDGAGAGWAKRKMEELEAAKEKSAEVEEPDPAYEWPEETKRFRLHIEGLEDDIARHKAASGGDADDDIREEKKTPAMRISSIIKNALDDVNDALIDAMQDGIVGPVGAKQKALSDQASFVKDELAEVRERVRGELKEALLDASKGGQQAGSKRLEEVLESRGAGRVGRVEVSDELLRSVADQTERLVKLLLEDTIDNFVNQIGADFSIQKETERLLRDGVTNRKRARMLARTESAAAYHEGQVDAWKQLGHVKTKHFIMAPAACPVCKAVSSEYGPGKKAIPFDKPVLSKGQRFTTAEGKTHIVQMDSFGGVHPNCRCDVRAVVDLDD